MATNGCGLWGGLSWVWRTVSGSAPPFEPCCDEHDLAYEQIESEADRAWADNHFRRCLRARGYRVSSTLLWAVVRVFGWVTWVMRRF